MSLSFNKGKCWPSGKAAQLARKCPDRLSPMALLVNDRSLYVSMAEDDVSDDEDTVQATEGIYEYLLPPELQFE